jgi:2-iminobutanoate/2-iminopropanoate deaminase
MIQTVSTSAAPAPGGHYSQALVHGGLVYVAGQLPIVAGEPQRRLSSFEEQARQVLDNVAAILEAAGSGLECMLKATVYVSDLAHWPAFNALYAQRLGAHRPARSVVPVALLHHGFLVEMDAIAALRSDAPGPSSSVRASSASPSPDAS